MFEAVIKGLIALVIMVIAVYLVIYVLGIIGFTIPAQFIPLLWVIGLLIVILFLYRIVKPLWGSWFP
jgi:hypothetical protein